MCAVIYDSLCSAECITDAVPEAFLTTAFPIWTFFPARLGN